MRRLRDMRQAEQSCRVRLRGQMEKTIVGREEINVRQIADRHRREIAMAQHRALRLSSRAAGVEDPGEVVRSRGRRCRSGRRRSIRAIPRRRARRARSRPVSAPARDPATSGVARQSARRAIRDDDRRARAGGVWRWRAPRQDRPARSRTGSPDIRGCWSSPARRDRRDVRPGDRSARRQSVAESDPYAA